MASLPRVVFMGSPAAALPVLRVLARSPLVRVAGVFTQPDKPAGRNRRLTPCAVKAAALEWGLPVATPDKAGSPEAMETLAGWSPHLVVVCAYGRLLPQRVLDAAPLGCFNLHFSLLPRWRGASPVQAALLAGDAATGVCLQRMVLQLDAGPLVAESGPQPIGPQERCGQLMERLAELGAGLLEEALPGLLAGGLEARPQDESQATHCGIIKKEEGLLELARLEAGEALRRLRAYDPWPGCYAFLGDVRLGLSGMERAEEADGLAAWAAWAASQPQAGLAGQPPQPGRLLPGGLVACRQGWLRLARVQPAGKPPMDWKAFINGRPQAVGMLLSAAPLKP